jgi:cell division transport system permease protein
MFDRILFIFSEALTALVRNRYVALLAVITTGVALYVLGGLGWAYSELTTYGNSLTGKFEMRVHLRETVQPAEVSAVAKELRALPGVASVVWIPKDRAWAKFVAEQPEFKGIENPYTESLKLTLNDLGQGDTVAQKARSLPPVDENGVNYMREEQRLVDQVLHLLRWLGTVAGTLLSLIAGVQIFSVVRLTAMSRKVEMRIMQLVGASHITTYGPFVIEGIVQGVLGGGLAWLLLRLTHGQIANVIPVWDSLSKVPAFPTMILLKTLVGAGAAYGMVCSLLALIRLHQKPQ